MRYDVRETAASNIYMNLDVIHNMHGSFDKSISEMTENSDAKDDDKKTIRCEVLRSNAQNIQCARIAQSSSF
jgi:hypothetical protein